MKELSLRELQLCCLEILKDVHSFCVNNNIKYSLQDGSLIGVVRHKGFIPWDDDIDVIMPRPDYAKFCRTYKSDKYEICSEYDDDCYLAFSRVYDTTETISLSPQPWCNRVVGVSIDILPADGAYNSINRHNRYYTLSRLLWKASCSLRWPIANGYSTKKSFRSNSYWLISKLFSAKFFARKVAKRAAKKLYGSTPYWTQMTCMGDNSKERHRIETLEHCSLMPFEDTEVMVMDGYDEVLRDKFGDYMQMPPIEKRKLHSSAAKFYWKK